MHLSEDLRLLFLPKLCNCPVSSLIALGWLVSIRVQVSEDKDGIILWFLVLLQNERASLG